MVNHPNRKKQPEPGYPGAPLPEQIRELRLDANLTQTNAARLIYSTLRTWQEWEAGGRGMHPAIFELFTLKVMSLKMLALKEPE